MSGLAIKRLCLLGGESSGKTTLAIALADALATVWVAEYGRQLFEEKRATLDVAELVHVAQRQVELEEQAAVNARAWLICDTSPLTTLQYCLADHQQAPAELVRLSRRHYDLVVLCEPDFAFVQDGARRDDSFRRQQHAWTEAQLAGLGLSLLRVWGTVAQRVAQVLDHLNH